MRKLLITAAAVVALTASGATPAVADSGTAGPYGSLSRCQDARKMYGIAGYQTTACAKTAKGYSFKYSK